MIDYRKYKVWQKAHLLVLELYSLTENFPKKEQFNLISQINRSVISIPTNIAEGCGRETQKELIRFLYIASGSAHEMEYLILVSKDLKYIDEFKYEKLSSQIIEIKKMLASLIKKISETL
ncbi:four helix bundle protein [Subsaxibacter sp. CAU 1640]|uniref:four helix bundle protein n=1 Tax=Subsaxibacter sp. CAU 1640 TaxID=2933271 RepID=UPI002006D7D0|nr:four helix bundle protein [Subsaxibacter sp. CAU 1640]MCK7589592.1 four helix bundle protein [Subsaxibacter sp. CAU 1640]